MRTCAIPERFCASAVVIHYEEALYQMYAPLHLPFPPSPSTSTTTIPLPLLLTTWPVYLPYAARAGCVTVCNVQTPIQVTGDDVSWLLQFCHLYVTLSQRLVLVSVSRECENSHRLIAQNVDNVCQLSNAVNLLCKYCVHACLFAAKSNGTVVLAKRRSEFSFSVAFSSVEATEANRAQI